MPLVGNTFVADDGRVWNLDTMVRTDVDLSTHPRDEWSDEEKAIADSWHDRILLTDLFAQLQTLIDSVALISTTATDDSTGAAIRQGDFETWATAATASAATIRGIGSPTVAQLQEEAAVAAERDVAVATEVDNFYVWRALVDDLLVQFSQCVTGLARLVTKTPDDTVYTVVIMDGGDPTSDV